MATSNEINQYTRSSQELTDNASTLAKTLKLGKEAFKDLKNITGNVGNAISAAGDDVQKWNLGINDSFSNITNYFGSSKNGVIATTANAVQGLMKIADALVGGVFKQVDTVMKFQGTVSTVGISATKTTEDLVNMAKMSGRPIDKAGKLMESFVSVGTSLSFLGPNTGKAAERLSKVFDNREDQLRYLKVGLNPDDLMKYQAEGIKFLTGYGVKIGEDDRVLRSATLNYVDTLTSLSILTGESRDQAAQRLASLKGDVSYQIKMRELIKSGNTKAADEFTKTLALLDNLPELKKGFSDFIANGQATTVEGKKLMLVMQSKAAQIAKDVEDGRMTGVEAARELGVQYQAYIKTNKDTLSVSKELQNAAGVTGKVMDETGRLANLRTEEDAKKLIDENLKKSDPGAEAKNKMFDAEREIGFVKDQVVKSSMSLTLAGFQTMIDVFKSGAYYIADFARIISGGQYTEGLEEIMMTVGTTKQIDKLKTESKNKLDDLNTRIERIKSPEKRKAEFAERTKIAEAEFNRLSDTHASQQQIETARAAMDAARVAERKEIAEQAQLKQSGVSVEQLESQRTYLQQRYTRIEKTRTAFTSAETAMYWEEEKGKQQQTKAELIGKVMSVDLSEASKYIEFGSQTGDAQHWAIFSSRNPALAKNVVLLAQEYFKVKNEKLRITSSYRSYDEQKALYDGWLKAGGNHEGKPTVNVPGYGNVTTPANPDVKETPHMTSTGIDISKDQLDYLEGRGILQRMGLRRPYRKDPVHIEKAMFGSSMLRGKEIELHGREALIELFNGTIPITLPPSFVENTFADAKSDIKPKLQLPEIQPKKSTNDAREELDLDLLERMDAQFDDLIAGIDKSNLLQHDIKTYMAA